MSRETVDENIFRIQVEISIYTQRDTQIQLYSHTQQLAEVDTQKEAKEIFHDSNKPTLLLHILMAEDVVVNALYTEEDLK